MSWNSLGGGLPLLVGLKFHPEVLPLFRYVAWVALILAVIVLRFSNLFDPLFAFVFDRLLSPVARNFPPPDREPKRSLRTKGGSRFTTKQLRRGPTAMDHHIRVFDCFALVLTLYGLADWLIIPTPYRLDYGERWTALVTIFVAGTLTIFIGTRSWDGRAGYKKWTFWVSVGATVFVTVQLMRWMGNFRPNWILLTLLLSVVAFLFCFGMLRRIDRHKLAVQRLQDQ